MTTTAQATAAPREIELAGSKYRLTPLKDREFGEFEAWVQDQQMAVARRNLDGLPAEDRAALLKHAYDQARRITLRSPEAMEIMASRAGAARLLWLGLRHENPELTPEQVGDMLADKQTIDQAMEQFDQTNATGSKAAKKKPRPRKARKSKSR